MALGSLFLMIFLAFKGFSPERNYKLFSKEILNNTNLNKIVLSDRPAWMALRPVLNKDKLIAMEVGDGFSEALIIDFLHNTNNTSKVSAVVYMKNREDHYSRIYPLFKELISETYCNKKKIGLGLPLQVVVLNCVN